MASNPFSHAAIVGGINTRQARRLEEKTSETVAVEAAHAMVASLGVDKAMIDGVLGVNAREVVHALRLDPTWTSDSRVSIRAVAEAAGAIRLGLCTTVLLVGGNAGALQDTGDTAPWTRHADAFTSSFGLYTAAHYAFVARRHMATHGTTPEQLAAAAAVVRNNGSVNPEAVMHGRGPYTVDDVLASPMITDPFHRLDCSITSEGGCAAVVAATDVAASLTDTPVHLLGLGCEQLGRGYRHPLVLESTFAGSPDDTHGHIGRRAARRAFEQAGLVPADVNGVELYDPFSFEIIRQLEAFGFCDLGGGGQLVEDGGIAFDGPLPANTDGGLLSFSHTGTGQLLQRVIRAVHQLQGVCASRQLDDPEVLLCSNGGGATMFMDVLLLGREAAT